MKILIIRSVIYFPAGYEWLVLEQGKTYTVSQALGSLLVAQECAAEIYHVK